MEGSTWLYVSSVIVTLECPNRSDTTLWVCSGLKSKSRVGVPQAVEGDRRQLQVR